ncbi:hypothetical protein CU669_08565 [Paramagnetospirillum kuznetsovii]|uniref:Uncharacterized protein n=2 Tax=Paramagnetospirillum kuznetsovii TaxID=2053833 RepID=A0A364NYM6_9PROT|nr:hypothetical protein CU669_08565 [Paramagnetospirillum kuznetsovii]
MFIPADRPVTADILLSAIDNLPLPSPIKFGIFGLSQNAVGRLRADCGVEGLGHLVTPPRAILARLLATDQNLVLPLAFPTVSEFVDHLDAVLPAPPDLRTIALMLGREESAASRWSRGENLSAYPAIRTMMALVSIDPAQTNRRWELLSRMANREARLRGIESLDKAGSWGAKIQPWLSSNMPNGGTAMAPLNG